MRKPLREVIVADECRWGVEPGPASRSAGLAIVRSPAGPREPFFPADHGSGLGPQLSNPR